MTFLYVASCLFMALLCAAIVYKKPPNSDGSVYFLLGLSWLVGAFGTLQEVGAMLVVVVGLLIVNKAVELFL